MHLNSNHKSCIYMGTHRCCRRALLHQPGSVLTGLTELALQVMCRLRLLGAACFPLRNYIPGLPDVYERHCKANTLSVGYLSLSCMAVGTMSYFNIIY